MTHPDWFMAIKWSPPVPVEVIRRERDRLPRLPGVYAFSSYPNPLDRNFGVLYVGKAANLHDRVQSYLADPADIPVNAPRSAKPRLNTSLRHVGKVGLLVEIQQKYRDPASAESFIWLRWTLQVGPEELERKLIQYLQPKHNDRLR